jgi:hypothetical protein
MCCLLGVPVVTTETRYALLVEDELSSDTQWTPMMGFRVRKHHPRRAPLKWFTIRALLHIDLGLPDRPG